MSTTKFLLPSSLTCNTIRRTYYKGNRKPPSDGPGIILPIHGEILYGIYPVKLALTAGIRDFNTLYYNPNAKRVEEIVAMAAERSIAVHPLLPKGLDGLSSRSERSKGVHQGVCADVSKLRLSRFNKDLDIPTPSESSPPLWLLLLGLTDPMNMGAILRSAYYLGVDKVLFPAPGAEQGLRCASATPIVSKASAGVLEVFRPQLLYSEVEEFLSEMKEKNGWHIVASSVHSNADSAPPRVRSPGTILVLGSEGSGMPPAIEAISQSFLHLPPGRVLDPDVDSLNVSVATALMIHTLKRK